MYTLVTKPVCGEGGCCLTHRVNFNLFDLGTWHAQNLLLAAIHSLNLSLYHTSMQEGEILSPCSIMRMNNQNFSPQIFMS